MPEEIFDSLIPQQADSADIVRLKHAQAAARLIEPAATQVTIVECFIESLWNYGWSLDWRPVVAQPTWFRKVLIWGATADGATNTVAITLRHGLNANRIVNPGEMVVIEAMPGQKLNLQDLTAMPAYGSDVLTFEIY